jgi:tyrosyl-tRNA synthetase
MLTFLPLEEIDAMADWKDAQLNTAKEILAYELTKLVHGEEEAEKAQASARALFGAASADANVPTATLTADDFTDGKIDLISVLVKAGLVPTRSEGRRAIEQGGVTFGDVKVTDSKATYTAEDFADGVIIRRGKKTYKKVVIA